ncbi:YTH domain-containing protein ECT4-like [Hevea brasiliensis]|uniref:YTH domain-containing protein ECT4-like n=1 Tax=Hevea brasiliensis TaxID=3981 RepID=UPI0025FF0342|nr:YTH domain-containing protein ECT4-like [Hevea brasiliensis]
MIAAGTELEKPESVPTGLKSESIRKLAGRDVASGKDGLPCGSTSFSCFSRDATSNAKGEVDGNSGIKGETDQESVGDLGIYNAPTSSYNYYYPEYNGSFTQLDDHVYRLITSGMQSDNGSLVYYLPGYNPYASGAVVGVDGQSVGQQAYFSSPGYLPHPVFYGSEAMPCYSWDSVYFSDVSNGNTGSQNGKYGSASTFAKSSGFNSMKSNDNTAGKSSKSTNTQAIRPLNKVSALGSDFSAGLSKGYHPVGNLPPFSIQKHGPFPHNCPMNYRQNGRIWNGNDRNKSGDRFYKNSDFETSNELTSGPRGSNKFPSLETAVKEDLGITVQRDQYNKPDFETKYADAKFYVIKSYNEDDIHKSIKYDVWASTPNGNKKLDAAFHEAEQRS